MKQFKVIAGSCPCVAQRRILQFGEVVSESFFIGNQAEDLVQRKFIEEIAGTDDAVVEEPEAEEPELLTEEEIKAERLKELLAMTIPTLTGLCVDKNIKFPTSPKKGNLIDLLIAEQFPAVK